MSLSLCVGCVERTSEPADGDSGAMASSGDAVGSGPESMASSSSEGVDEPSTTSASTGADVACGEPWDLEDGLPCDADQVGLECPFTDYCATGYYACEDGAWRLHTTHGCGAEPVACGDGPEDQNGCDEPGLTCDPDGDCLDVLECEGSNWVARDVCNASACPEANPGQGLPCDDPRWRCEVELECGVARAFACTTDGYWRDVFGDQPPCASPMPCEDGPLLGDACMFEMEVCRFEDPQLGATMCVDGIWS